MPEDELADNGLHQPVEVGGDADDQVVHGEHADDVVAGDDWEPADAVGAERPVGGGQGSPGRRDAVARYFDERE